MGEGYPEDFGDDFGPRPDADMTPEQSVEAGRLALEDGIGFYDDKPGLLEKQQASLVLALAAIEAA